MCLPDTLIQMHLALKHLTLVRFYRSHRYDFIHYILQGQGLKYYNALVS
jgi:hypothetical protein